MVKFSGRQQCCSIKDEKVVAHVAAGRQNIGGMKEKKIVVAHGNLPSLVCLKAVIHGSI